MKDFNELITKVREYQYLEDVNSIKMNIASVVSTRLKLSTPIWFILIGASSGGKSQILRPLSITDPKFLHRVDDLTENTFLSGMKAKKGEKEPSLLRRIGNHGMIVISDLTVIFSKAKEARAVILSQLRMIYDGEMNKFSGTSNEPLHWHGDVGIIAGSTPSIYAHFEEVADMGERFIYYRMKDFDDEKATRLALSRKMNGRELDEKLSGLYADYIKKVVKNFKGDADLPEAVIERIIKVASFAERVRTPAHLDWREKTIDKIPVQAKPMRVALQLEGLAKGLVVMFGEIQEDDIRAIEWCGYSLANEEKRAILKILAGHAWDEGQGISTQKIADLIGLSTSITGTILQNLASINVIKRDGRGDSLFWSIKNKNDWDTVRRLEDISENRLYADRELSQEEMSESEELSNNVLDNWGK